MGHFSWFTHLDLIKYDHLFGMVIVLVLLLLAALKVRSKIVNSDTVLPGEKFSLTNIFEILSIDFLLNLIAGIFGSKKAARTYFPILATSFFVILFANILGLIPGFLPPTGNFNTTLALALVIFVMYNYYGIKENGWSYLKHFLGPMIYLAPLMLIIEIISHLVRPLSLSLRLFWNMTGDHLVLGIFTDLTHIIIPVLFVGLGLFVSFLQAFIFTILSSIYISLSIAHEH
ncbi:MAG TPA: F0F1 ATP synthase subunit A [Thermodesulfobacteriota bacterium]|nr:F0F1 ATP synthase subunit A [Thermodesulfobacteriota bacterium]